MPWMMLANACNAVILVAALWMSPDRLAAMGWASTIIAFAVFYGSKSPAQKPQFVSACAIRRAVTNALLLGSLWAELPLLFFAYASSGGQLVITCLCAGMLCGGVFTFASIPVAAITFAGPLFIASAIAIGRSGDQTA